MPTQIGGWVVVMNRRQADAFAELLEKARRQASPQDRARMDQQLRAAGEQLFARFEAIDKALVALDVLHGNGAGERSGFCAECGNVFPCQTRKFIAPFLSS